MTSTTRSGRPDYAWSLRLSQWMEDNQDMYPSQRQKQQLTAENGMEFKQVDKWFQNHRQKIAAGMGPTTSTCYEIRYEDGDTEDLTPADVRVLINNAMKQGYEDESDSSEGSEEESGAESEEGTSVRS